MVMIIVLSLFFSHFIIYNLYIWWFSVFIIVGYLPFMPESYIYNNNNNNNVYISEKDLVAFGKIIIIIFVCLFLGFQWLHCAFCIIHNALHTHIYIELLLLLS